MLSKPLEQALAKIFREVKEKRHQFMTVEHLLLALTEDKAAADVLVACKGNVVSLRQELTAYINSTVPVFAEKEENNPQPTLAFQRVLNRAAFHVNASGKQEISGANVLVAIYNESESQAVFLLHKQNILRVDVINYISHGISKLDEEEEYSDHEEASDERAPGKRRSALRYYTQNLNELARQGDIDPLIGREQEVERLAQILIRRRKNNPLLVGEAGVGKTAIVEGVAKKIIDEDIPEPLAECEIYSLDMGALLAGTKYRGDFEKRFKQLLAELHKKPNAILFIDEIHTVIGAGSASGGAMNASNLLKPVLASGNLRCIGSTTFQEFRGIFEKDRALARRFQKINVPEPTVDESYQILRGLKSRFEEHHQLRYTDGALRSATDLSTRHINDRFLPDKAIDVIDEAGAYQRLQPSRRRKKTVNTAEVEEVVARMARIPSRRVSSSDKEVLQRLDDSLKRLIFGQDPAIAAVTSAIKVSRAGLVAGNKPVGSFLFAGPTGVGKTELSRQLAKVMGLELLRFDMSEYMERHTASRLIGAPPGYIGFDQGGLLTDAVTKNPHSVILFDEIEKAHSDIFNLLLQIMDHGTLTDNNGRKADFRNTILIMTTNAGAESISRPSMGFTYQDHSTDASEAIRRMFPPEFRNRLDGIVHFAPLQEAEVLNIVDKFLTELQAQIEDKKIFLQVDDDARKWLLERGYDPKMGARPMERVIHKHVRKDLSDMVLFGDLAQDGGTVYVSVEDGKLALRAEPAAGSESSPKSKKKSRRRSSSPAPAADPKQRKRQPPLKA